MPQYQRKVSGYAIQHRRRRRILLFWNELWGESSCESEYQKK